MRRLWPRIGCRRMRGAPVSWWRSTGVGLLEQEGEADTGEESDARAEDRASMGLGWTVRPARRRHQQLELPSAGPRRISRSRNRCCRVT